MEAADPQVRMAAVGRLTDPATLARMGMWVKPELTRQVTDQGLLVRIAVEAVDWEVRRAAAARLTDQTPLARLGVEAADWSVRAAAVAQLTDQRLLGNLAVAAKWLDVRIFAISEVGDQKLLRQLAKNDPQAAIRQAAVTRIADDEFLVQRLRTESSDTVRAIIVKTLRTEAALRNVAITSYYQRERDQAVQRLGQRVSPVADEALTARRDLTRRVTALDVQSDSGNLLALTLKGDVDVLRAAAARRLADPTAVAQAAVRATDREVLRILFEKLRDKELLGQVADAADYRPVRLAAAIKAGLKPWEKVFDATAARGATVEMLGDALAAVSLFSDVQPEAVNGVQRACLSLIQRGDETHIPAMVDLLEGYGDTALAEAYLNSGQPDLEGAARTWADRRGYAIGPGAEVQRAMRGSGR